MASVQNEEGVAAQKLKTARPADSPDTGLNGGVRDIPVPIPQQLQHAQHQGEILPLMLAQQWKLQRQLAPAEALAAEIVTQRHQYGRIGPIERNVLLAAEFLNDRADGGDVRIERGGAAGLEDARLGAGNGLHGAAKVFGVIQPDVGEDGGFRGGDHVRRVQLAAHSGFEHHDVRTLVGIPLQGNGGVQLKLRGRVCHRVGIGADEFRFGGKSLAGDHLAVDLHPLAEVDHPGGDKQAGLVTGLLQHRGQHGSGAALSVCTDDVNKFEPLFGVSEPPHQLRDPFQPGNGALPVDGGDVL